MDNGDCADYPINSEESVNDVEIEPNPNNGSNTKLVNFSTPLYKSDSIKNESSYFHTIKDNIRQFRNKILTITVMRWLDFCLIVIFIIIMIAGLVVYNIQENRHNYILLTIEFYPAGFYPFLTNPYALLLTLIPLTGTLLSICNTLILYRKGLTRSFIKDTGTLLPISLIMLSISFLIGIFTLKSQTTMIVNIILYSIGSISVFVIVLRVKKHKFPNVEGLVNQGFMPSFLLSIFLYLLIYSISDLITRTPLNSGLETTQKKNTNIYANLTFFCIGMGILTMNQDIIVPVCVIIFSTGMLTRTNIYSFIETLVILLVTMFSFSIIVITIFKKKKKVFKIDPDEIMVEYEEEMMDGNLYENFDDSQ